MVYSSLLPKKILSSVNDGFSILTCNRLNLIGNNDVEGEGNGYADVYARYVVKLKGRNTISGSIVVSSEGGLVERGFNNVIGHFYKYDSQSCPLPQVDNFIPIARDMSKNISDIENAYIFGNKVILSGNIYIQDGVYYIKNLILKNANVNGKNVILVGDHVVIKGMNHLNLEDSWIVSNEVAIDGNNTLFINTWSNKIKVHGKNKYVGKMIGNEISIVGSNIFIYRSDFVRTFPDKLMTTFRIGKDDISITLNGNYLEFWMPSDYSSDDVDFFWCRKVISVIFHYPISLFMGNTFCTDTIKWITTLLLI